MEPSGREYLVVAVKGTFTIPPRGKEAELAEEPGLSAPVYETDYPLRKPRCDVLLLGSTYAPEGRPAERVQIGASSAPSPRL